MPNVYAPQIFFIVFRECLEAIIVISVLFSFIKKSLGGPDQDQAIYKKLRRQVWWGAISGIGCCFVIGGAFIAVFYTVGRDIWSTTEDLWEGIFYLVATIIITVMGLALLRINKTKEKWKVKLAQAIVEHKKKNDGTSRLSFWSKRYVMFILPFVTTMREGVEAVVFVGGVSLGYPASSFPLPVVTGIIAAGLVGYFLYRGGNQMSIRIFLIFSSCILYLIAAGMFSKAIWSLQYHVFAVKVGSDVAEAGNGQGSYNILETVWHLDCCNPETDDGWDVFNAVLGWQNTATYGSIISYNLYWIFLACVLACMMHEEKTGSLPLKRPILNFLLKVPLVNLWVKRKVVVSQDRATELVRQGHEHLQELGHGPIGSDELDETKQGTRETTTAVRTIEE